jgi:hypothetical protein
VRIATKLDTLLKKHSVEHVDYLKLDVQVKLNKSDFIAATKYVILVN